jgi:molybdate transport system substrate-binding protein
VTADVVGAEATMFQGCGKSRVRAATLGLMVILAQPVIAHAAEIKVFTTRAIATVLHKVGPDFERATGHELNVTTDIAIRMVRRIQAGEPFDCLVAAPGQIDALIKDGKIVAETRTDLARSGIGVQVRAGARKPDISSVEAFKQALLDAKSIAYLKEGQSGVYLSGLMERLGIAEAIRSKVTRPDTDIVSQLVARGDVELGMVVITQILTSPGVELVGPLPPEIQSYITFAAGVSTSSSVPGAAKDLLRFLTGPSAIAVIRSQGMEP